MPMQATAGVRLAILNCTFKPTSIVFPFFVSFQMFVQRWTTVVKNLLYHGSHLHVRQARGRALESQSRSLVRYLCQASFRARVIDIRPHCHKVLPVLSTPTSLLQFLYPSSLPSSIVTMFASTRSTAAMALRGTTATSPSKSPPQ